VLSQVLKERGAKNDEWCRDGNPFDVLKSANSCIIC
jgi:hypothetical protein